MKTKEISEKTSAELVEELRRESGLYLSLDESAENDDETRTKLTLLLDLLKSASDKNEVLMRYLTGQGSRDELARAFPRFFRAVSGENAGFSVYLVQTAPDAKASGSVFSVLSGLFPLPKNLLGEADDRTLVVVTSHPVEDNDNTQIMDPGDSPGGPLFAGLSGKKPVLMIICGSLGSVAVNGFVREALPRFIEKFDIIHLTGKGNLDESLVGKYDGYKQFEYISGELPDLFAAADILISRAGANAICEIAALAKPNVLIPLPLSASRGDQIKNAESFEKQGFSAVLDQDSCTASDVADCVFSVYDKRDAYIEKMKENASGNGAIMKIADLIQRLAGSEA